MKKILLSLLLTIPCTGYSATVALAKGIGATNPGIAVLDASGNALSAGGFVIAAGTFVSVPTITDYASLVAAINDSANFKLFGTTTSPTTGNTNAGLIASAAGITAAPATPTDFNTKEMFLVVGNAASLALSTQFAIVRGAPTAFSFGTDVTASTSYNFGVGNVNVNSPLANAGTETDTASGPDTLRLVGAPVPEPTSVALLGLIGLVGLRRKR